VKRGEEIVREASGQLRDAIGGGRRDKEEIDGLCNEDVIESPFEIAAGLRAFKDVDVDLVAGKRSECQRRYKLGRALCHQDGDIDATVLKPSDDFGRFVARNASTDSECDFHLFDGCALS
jgi:hypothetical protein